MLECLDALEYVDLSYCPGIESIDCLVENEAFRGSSGHTLVINRSSWIGVDDELKDGISCLRTYDLQVMTDCPDCSATCTNYDDDFSGTCETSSDQCSN